MVKNKKKKSTIKEGKGSLIFDIINYILLGLIFIAMVYPIYYIIILSLSNGMDAAKGGIFLWPRTFTLDNYITAFTNKYLFKSYVVTILRTIVGTLVSVVMMALMAYALADKRLPGRKWMSKFFYFTTLFGGGSVIMLLLIRDLDLLDNFMVYILPAIYGFSNMLIIKIAFEGIPVELRESAEMDGAGDLKVFWHVYLPLAKPSLVTVGLFTAVIHWNDWYAGKYYVTSQSLKPAATILQEMITNSASTSGYLTANSTTTAQTLQAAFVVIIMLPIMLIYPFAQKYFVKGAIVGSIKE